MYEQNYPQERFQITLDFLAQHSKKTDRILDLGVSNPLSKLMQQQGYSVTNTSGVDLDNNQEELLNENYDVLTAFEIIEHLLNPYTILKQCKAQRIFISVPLRLWFSTAYQSKTDMRDRHYHEFEDWQLDWLLEKVGYKVNKIGFRPLLRRFTPRYYLVYAERI